MLTLWCRIGRSCVRIPRIELRKTDYRSDSNSAVASVAAQHGVPAYESAEHLLDAHKSGSLAVDGIILATPTQTHTSLCQLFAGSGLAILVEKPLSSTGSDGKQMLSTSKKDKNNVYMVGHHRRHNAYVKAVKAILEKEKLGRVVAVNGGMRPLRSA